VPDTKKLLESRISDIDKMLSELEFNNVNEEAMEMIDPKIDINQLDVVDVLHGILNQSGQS
jgi:hypothetical protein